MGETPCVARTFGRQFSPLSRKCPERGRAECWVSLVGDPWWSRVTTYTCTEFEDQLRRIQLLPAVLAMRQGVRANVNNFLGMLEQYNPETCTFFMPVREVGI